MIDFETRAEIISYVLNTYKGIKLLPIQQEGIYELRTKEITEDKRPLYVKLDFNRNHVLVSLPEKDSQERVVRFSFFKDGSHSLNPYILLHRFTEELAKAVRTLYTRYYNETSSQLYKFARKIHVGRPIGRFPQRILECLSPLKFESSQYRSFPYEDKEILRVSRTLVPGVRLSLRFIFQEGKVILDKMFLHSPEAPYVGFDVAREIVLEKTDSVKMFYEELLVIISSEYLYFNTTQKKYGDFDIQKIFTSFKEITEKLETLSKDDSNQDVNLVPYKDVAYKSLLAKEEISLLSALGFQEKTCLDTPRFSASRCWNKHFYPGVEYYVEVFYSDRLTFKCGFSEKGIFHITHVVEVDGWDESILKTVILVSYIRILAKFFELVKDRKLVFPKESPSKACARRILDMLSYYEKDAVLTLEDIPVGAYMNSKVFQDNEYQLFQYSSFKEMVNKSILEEKKVLSDIISSYKESLPASKKEIKAVKIIYSDDTETTLYVK